jgi:hypothetical protein
MAKTPSNHGNAWTRTDVKQLLQLAGQNTPTRVIGLKMGRTPDAVQSKAGEKRMSLNPTNQPPYSQKK